MARAPGWVGARRLLKQLRDTLQQGGPANRRLDQVTLIEEVAAFANSLRGKMPLGIATGGSRRVIEKTLCKLGVSDWFDEVVTAEDVAEGKPAPDVFLKCAALLGVRPVRCLVLEDAPPGIVAARRAGMQVIAIPTPMIAVVG